MLHLLCAAASSLMSSPPASDPPAHLLLCCCPPIAQAPSALYEASASAAFQIAPTATGRYNALAYSNDSLACVVSPKFSTTASLISESPCLCAMANLAQARTCSQNPPLPQVPPML